MLFLFTVVIQLFASGAVTLGSSSSSISTPVILTSASPSSIVYSCFFTNDDEQDPRSSKEACCKGVVDVWQTSVNDNNSDGSNFPSIELHQSCMLEIAQFPSSISSATPKTENPDDTAKFSWVVSKSTDSVAQSASKEQYLWKTDGGGNDKFQRDPAQTQTITPYHKTSIQSPMQNTSHSTPIIASNLNSSLGRDGGMHRLFHHRFESVGSTDGGEGPTYFMYVTIPTGMFIDLDDPIESTMGTIQSAPIEYTDDDTSDASSSFVVITPTQPKIWKSSVLSFRARLHAATVCDIEQPSFVSGQHLLVWEIDRIVTSNDAIPPMIEFATKLHLRYPHPSSTLEEWIDLPSPLLFAARNSEPVVSNDRLGKEYDWSLGVVERVWVAAGKDDDHDWIMGMTISFCLIGVAIMLRDISRVSLWDDV